MNYHISLHDPRLHPSDAKLLPGQVVPPWAGAGLVQDLVLVLVPVVQVLEQADHVDHEDQPPFTAPEIRKINCVLTSVNSCLNTLYI